MMRTSLFKMIYKIPPPNKELDDNSKQDDLSSKYEAADIETKIDFWTKVAEKQGYVCKDGDLREKLIRYFIERGHPTTWQGDELTFKEIEWTNESHFFQKGAEYEMAGLANTTSKDITCIFDKEWENEFPYKN